MTYAEKLKDPRWQKKRLEIFNRDKFTCRSCGCDGNTLNVHHLVNYRKDAEPWEYENDELVTLCELCHNKVTEYINDITSIVKSFSHSTDRLNQLSKIMDELSELNMGDLAFMKDVIRLYKG